MDAESHIPGSAARPAQRGAALQRTLTEGPITRTLVTFSLPLLGGNVLQSLNASVNQFWVSHMLGVTAITAIGNANLLMMMLIGVVFGVSMAANILVAQGVGANDEKLVKRVMGTATAFFLTISVGLAVVGWVFSPHVLALMQTPPAARAEAVVYLRIVFVAMPFMYFFSFIQMAQRGAGDSHTPFYFMALAVCLDACMNPLLIGGLGPFKGLGIAGSACSTLISQGVSLTLMMVHLYRRHSVVMLQPHEFGLLKPDPRLLRPLVLRGLPMGVQILLVSTAAIVMIGFVNSYGAVTAAAYVGAQQVWTYIQMPGLAIGAAVSSMVAQNVGASRWDRVPNVAMSGLAVSLLITSSTTLLIYLAGPLPLYLFLPPGSPTIPIALHINRTVLWSYILFNSAFCLNGTVRATGAVMAPTVFLFVAMWLIRIPFTLVLTPHFGAEAIWWSFPLGMFMFGLQSILYYRFGGWRRMRMLEPEVGGETGDVGLAVPAMDPHEADEPEPASEGVGA
jgi:putative MATE family efflux protein